MENSATQDKILTWIKHRDKKYFHNEKIPHKGRVLLDPGWVSKYENSLNLNLIVPDGL